MSAQRRRGPRVGVLIALAALIATETILLLQVADYAYARIGVSAQTVLLLLVASVVCSAVNVPIARLRPVARRAQRRVVEFGVPYVVPVLEQQPGTIVAVNVGGAVIPTGLSLWLLVHDHAWVPALAATIIVTGVVHGAARIDPGVGIEIPAIVPPLAAAAVALTIGGHHEAMVAYVGGTLGTLAGADLLNLGRLRALGGGVVSIGGAGTFDGVFLSGLGAVLIAALA